MRILWLATDRRHRANDFYAPLRRALSAREDVEIETILRTIPKEEGKYCRDVVDGMENERLVDPAHANTFDLVITEVMWAYESEEWDRIHTRKACIFSDCHGDMVAHYVGRAHSDFGFSLFLPHYRDAPKEFHPELFTDPSVKVVWFQCPIDETIYRDYGEPKVYDSLMTGVIHRQVYPWRWKVDEILAGQEYYTRISRPPEDLAGGLWPVGEDYARFLNRSRMAFSCCSRYGYTVTKVYEIPACMSVLVSDFVPEMEEMGFVDGVNFLQLRPEATPRERVESWLAGDLGEIAQAGHDLIHSKYTSHHKAADLLAKLRE